MVGCGLICRASARSAELFSFSAFLSALLDFVGSAQFERLGQNWFAPMRTIELIFEFDLCNPHLLKPFSENHRRRAADNFFDSGTVRIEVDELRGKTWSSSS